MLLQAWRGGVRGAARASDGGVGARATTRRESQAAARGGGGGGGPLPQQLICCSSWYVCSLVISSPLLSVSSHACTLPPCARAAAGRRRLMLGWRAHLEVPAVAAGGGGDGGIMILRPRLVVHHIKSCRGPPRLSLLDRFHADGEGACLKKYTDPSFFRRMRDHRHSSIISASGSSAKLQQRRTVSPN